VDRAEVDCLGQGQSADGANCLNAQAPAGPSLDPARGATPLAFLVDDVGESERQSRLRELRRLSLLLFGARHKITVALGEAVANPSTTDRALRLLDAAPALPKRHLLATFVRLL
jgi:hypothetical protein